MRLGKDERDRTAASAVASAASFIVHGNAPIDIVRPTDVERLVGASNKVHNRHTATMTGSDAERQLDRIEELGALRLAVARSGHST